MKGQLTINGRDAYTTWGVSLGEGSVAELLTAPDVKDYVTNDCPNEDGVRVMIPSDGLKYKQRQVQLTINISSRNGADYLEKYRSFVSTLKKDITIWRLSEDSSVTYRLVYEKMENFSQVDFKLAKFVLNMIEPNPANRK